MKFNCRIAELKRVRVVELTISAGKEFHVFEMRLQKKCFEVSQFWLAVSKSAITLNVLSNVFSWRTFLKTRISLLSYVVEGCRFDWKGNFIGKTITEPQSRTSFAIPLRNVRDRVTDGLPRTIIQRKHGIAVFNKQSIFVIHQSSNSASFEENRIKWRSTSQVFRQVTNEQKYWRLSIRKWIDVFLVQQHRNSRLSSWNCLQYHNLTNLMTNLQFHLVK